MKHTLMKVYLAAGLFCFAYFLALGIYKRFGLSMSWIWPVGGAVCLLAAASFRFSVPTVLRYGFRALLILGLLFVCVLEVPVIRHMRDTAPENLDYVFVLGARVEEDGRPSLALKHRIDAASEYLKRNPDTIAVASGGKGSDEVISEAQCIYEGLLERGIDASRILIEDSSTNTEGNMAHSLEQIKDPNASVGLITNNYHIYRSIQTAKEAGFTGVYGIAASYTGISLPHFMIREAFALAANLVFGYRFG